MEKIERIKRDVNADIDVFSRGSLCHVHIRCWGAMSRLGEEFYGEKMPPEIVRAVYDLLKDKTALKDLHAMRDEAHRFVDRFSMPYPVPGLSFILKQDIEAVDAGLRRREEEFGGALTKFLASYEADVADFANTYPHLYKPKRYPSLDQMRDRFHFSWVFRMFQVPTEKMSVLPPEVYKEELNKMRAEALRMRDVAISAIGAQFLKKIEALGEQCKDGGMVHTSTVNSLRDFLDRFDKSWDGYLGHQKLSEMVEQCKHYLDDVGADEIRLDDDFRKMVGDKMAGISKQFRSIADARLKRRLDF